MPTEYEFIYQLSTDHITGLLELFKDAPWAMDRKEDDIRVMLENSWTCAIADKRSGKLIAFNRVLSDHVYRAFIYDVIVASEYRGQGLGRLILENTINSSNFKDVERLELYCRDHNVEFYEKLGFEKLKDITNLMRYKKTNH